MKHQTYRRWVIGLGSVALVAVLGWAFRPRPMQVDVAPVTRGSLVVTVDEEGRTRIKERHTVSAPLGGRLLRVVLKPGDAVEAGRTVIAVIEPSDPGLLDPRTRAQAEARVKAAAAARERMGPMVERAATAHDYAALELARARDLFAHNGISRQEFDVIEAREATASTELKSVRSELRIADYELEAAKAALLDEPATAEGGRRFEVRAPITGRVLRVFQESSTVMAAGTPLVELGDPTDLEVEVEVLSTDAVKIVPGARVIIDHWGGEAPLAGRVRLVEPAAFTKVSALGVEEQRVLVRVDFADPLAMRRGVGDAFRVEARIVTWESANALMVPIGALYRRDGRWAVFTVKSGRAVSTQVEIGHRNTFAAEVRSGLVEGDSVILNPGDQLETNKRVWAR